MNKYVLLKHRHLLWLAWVCFFLLSLGMFWLRNTSPTVISSPTQVELHLPAVTDAAKDLLHVPSRQSSLVRRIDVVPGQHVKKGERLILLDEQAAKQQVFAQKLVVLQTKSRLMALEKDLSHARIRLKKMKDVDPRAISRMELFEQFHQVEIKTLELNQCKKEYDATQRVLKMAKRALRECSITAPKQGIVVQIVPHVNEGVGSGQTVVLLGDEHKVMVRVSLDERDIRRFKQNAPGFLEANGQRVPLKFIQLEQQIVNQERFNARVQEMLYYYHRQALPEVVSGGSYTAIIAIKEQV